MIIERMVAFFLAGLVIVIPHLTILVVNGLPRMRHRCLKTLDSDVEELTVDFRIHTKKFCIALYLFLSGDVLFTIFTRVTSN